MANVMIRMTQTSDTGTDLEPTRIFPNLLLLYRDRVSHFENLFDPD